MNLIPLTTLTCRAPTIGIAGPEEPATWTEGRVYVNADRIEWVIPGREWGRGYSTVVIGETQWKVAENAQQIAALTAAREATA